MGAAVIDGDGESRVIAEAVWIGRECQAVCWSSPMVLKMRSRRSQERLTICGVGEREEEDEEGEGEGQKLGGELHLLAGSFSVRSGAVWGERGGAAQGTRTGRQVRGTTEWRATDGGTATRPWITGWTLDLIWPKRGCLSAHYCKYSTLLPGTLPSARLRSPVPCVKSLRCRECALAEGRAHAPAGPPTTFTLLRAADHISLCITSRSS